MKPRTALYFILAATWVILTTPMQLPAHQPTGAGTSSERGEQATAVAVAPAPATKPTLADLAWLAGRWQGTWGPRVAQQTWTVPTAGVMLGTFQLAESDKTLVLEFFTLVENAGGVKLYLRHFTPSLTPWEKPGPTILNLQSADAKSVVFVNPLDGQPKQIVIMRVDADVYVSRSEIVSEKGDEQATEITYHRVVDGPPLKHHGSKSKAP
jgi:Domain of unknown function (DUF6265)